MNKSFATRFWSIVCLTALGPWWAAGPALGEDQAFNSSASATAAGWTGSKNTTGGNNFTWNNSNAAGGAPGEAGGTFKRVSSGNAGWYADTALGGILTLTNSLSASGRLVITNVVNANQHWWLGHLGTSGFDGGGTDSFLWRSLDNGITWNDQRGRTSGRHSTIVPLDGSGRLLSYGGKNSQINGYMPQNLSSNWGVTWNTPTQSRFPQLGGNQRPSLWRLTNGKLVMVGDSQLKGTSTPPAGWTNGPGAYVAISADNGSTWRIKSLPVTLPHESDKLAGTLGYTTVRQAPNGVLHVLTTMTHPCLHYELNEAWVYSDDGDIPPETGGGTLQSFSENHPGGALRATWTARITPNGRYLLDGLETTYHANGQKEHEATWVSGRRTGLETFWSQEGTKIWSWTHNPASNTSTWVRYWRNGRKRVESNWNTHPAARDLLPVRNFRGLVAHGPAYHWNQDGTGRAGYRFSRGTLTGTLSAPPAQP